MECDRAIHTARAIHSPAYEFVLGGNISHQSFEALPCQLAAESFDSVWQHIIVAAHPGHREEEGSGALLIREEHPSSSQIRML